MLKHSRESGLQGIAEEKVGNEIAIRLTPRQKVSKRKFGKTHSYQETYQYRNAVCRIDTFQPSQCIRLHIRIMDETVEGEEAAYDEEAVNKYG